jgi:hypothetical protein
MTTGLEDALADFERRDQLFRAEAAAVVDDTTQPYRVVRWVAKQFGLQAGAFSVRRFPAAIAPRHRGFVWKDSRTIYLSSSAGRRTEIHEALHLLRPDLNEAEVCALVDELDAEADVVPTPPQHPAADDVTTTVEEKADATDWVY